MRETLGLSRPVPLPRRAWRLPLLLGSALVALLAWLVSSLGLASGFGATVADPFGALSTLSTIFLGIFVEAVPFVLLGVVASTALHLFVSEERLTRVIPRHIVPATLGGALLGLVFPVCECGVVPVSRRLMQKGAPPSLGIAFLLAAPVVNPVVIASTWVAFGGDWTIVAWRVGLTLLIAVGVGLVFALHPAPRMLLATRPTGDDGGDGHDHHHHPPARLGERARAMLWHSGAEFAEMSRYLILGALLAAALQTFVPRAALLELGSSPVSSVLVMIGLGVVLSICSTVDAFIALSFAGTFSTGAVLAFLVFGPMLDIKSTLMFLSVFQRRAVSLIILLVFQMVLLASLWINYTWG